MEGRGEPSVTQGKGRRALHTAARNVGVKARRPPATSPGDYRGSMGFMDRMKERAEELQKKAAPKAQELREKAGPKAEELREKAKPYAEKAKERAGEMAQNAKKSAQNLRDELKDDKPSGSSGSSGGSVTEATPPPPGPSEN